MTKPAVLHCATAFRTELSALFQAAQPPALDLARPLVLTSIGTSLHPCQIATAWVRTLTAGRIRPAALDARDVALTESLRPEDRVAVVGDRGRSTNVFLNQILRTATHLGARTIVITESGQL